MTNEPTVSIPDDIARFNAMGLLSVLLKDHTTCKNIIWATDNYSNNKSGFLATDEITIDEITGVNAELIKRRAQKDKESQSSLTRSHAEVFTPSWIVKLMVDAADEAWSDTAHVILSEPKRRVEGSPECCANRSNTLTAEDQVIDEETSYWQQYVSSNRLEITCGEAPYLVNRYDAATGDVTPLAERTGILSRKLALVNKFTTSRDDWMYWATIALQSIYGYEFQGDNLLIARINVLCTMEDYLSAAGHKSFSPEEYARLANIISWNLWQMDGLKNCVPFGKTEKDLYTPDMFAIDLEDTTTNTLGNCIIYDWKNDEQVEFATIRQGNSMKFDYIIGNPPYQEEQEGDNANFAPPIYNKFIDGAYEISDKVELITPARFLFNAGSTPKAWNEKMLNDPHLKVLYYEADSSKVFPNTDIKGGVAITYHDATKNFGAIKTFLTFEELRSIVSKVNECSEPSFAEIVFPSETYKFTDLLHEDIPSAEEKLSKGHKYDLKTSVLSTLDRIVFYDEMPDDKLEYVQVLGLIDNRRVYRWINRTYLKGASNFESFKVILPKSNGSGALGEVLSTPLIGLPLIGLPLIGHTQSFISIGNFATEEEARACLKYVKSKFARTLLGVLKITQDNPPSKWKYVPLQDFTSSSDIDWSQSVAEIDAQLYKKYGLSDDEIEFIETHVREME